MLPWPDAENGVGATVTGRNNDAATVSLEVSLGDAAGLPLTIDPRRRRRRVGDSRLVKG